VARELTVSEKRTIRAAVLLVGAYLVLLYGFKGWRWLEDKRAEYAALASEASSVKERILMERFKGERLRKLKNELKIDLAALREETIVGEARGAIQAAAQSSGVQIITSKESPGRAAGKELASFQIEAVAPLPSAIQLLRNLRSTGYPVVVDRVQFQRAGMQPGQVKLSLAAAVLSFKEWKPAGQGGSG
jgi:hypothetical protein